MYRSAKHGEYYYNSHDVYSDTNESTTILAHSNNTWTLCDAAPSFKDNPMVKNDNEFDNWLLEEIRKIVYQGLLDKYSDYNVYKADLEQAHEPLKSSIRPPAVEDWERMRKYFGYVHTKTVCNTYKHSTQHSVFPPSSHLQKRFKSPNLLLNLHGQNKANATDLVFSDTPTMDGGETSAHIFVGLDPKMTNVYKAKNNSEKEFMGAMQDRV